MKVRVKPTRMALLALRKRLELARRGHKLLKDKLEALVRELTDILAPYLELRRRVDEELLAIFSLATVGGLASSSRDLLEALKQTTGGMEIEASSRRLMGVELLELAPRGEPGALAYSFLDVAPAVDVAVERLGLLIPDLIELAQTEDSIRRLAWEIQKTRRRTNALEYVVIPELDSVRKSITEKLAELERSSITRLMRVKAMIEERAEA
ncbi:MAG: V-type ATP synthase subunit D [Planctomycetes bacterium]|nr:V-type ATP synthase subunit D [Planctomycetota bacterium]